MPKPITLTQQRKALLDAHFFLNGRLQDMRETWGNNPDKAAPIVRLAKIVAGVEVASETSHLLLVATEVEQALRAALVVEPALADEGDDS